MHLFALQLLKLNFLLANSLITTELQKNAKTAVLKNQCPKTRSFVTTATVSFSIHGTV